MIFLGRGGDLRTIVSKFSICLFLEGNGGDGSDFLVLGGGLIFGVLGGVFGRCLSGVFGRFLSGI